MGGMDRLEARKGRRIAGIGLAGCMMLAWLAGADTAAAGEQVRDVTGFDRVMFALPGKLTLIRGDAHEVVVDATEEDLERIETRVRGETLEVRWRDGVFDFFGGRPEGPIDVRVTLPALRGLEVAGSGEVQGGSWLSETMVVEVNGSGSVYFDELASEELTFELSGSGNLEVADVDAALARVEINGSGDATLAGAADRQEIEVMGSGDVGAAELEGARVSVEIMGSGNVQVWANEALTTQIMGSGDVRYRGQPRLHNEEHGSGNVREL